MKTSPKTVLIVLVLLAGQPLKSNIFGDLAARLKQNQESIGNGIGRAVGVKLSGVVEMATAPALDNAAAKFSQVVNSAAGKLDESLASENQSIDVIAQQNLNRLDTVASTRLDQLDSIVDTRLQQLQAEANTLLNREARIIDTALKQENTIANNALDRVQTISNQTLSRLQGIESDAFDRVDSALQDQVPVAASQVAHEFVIGAVVVACIVALFAFTGIHLWKSLQLAKAGEPSMWRTLKTGIAGFWQTFPQELAVFVLPTVLIAAAVLGGYEGYLRTTRAVRVSRLEKAGSLLESAGDYKAAAEMRRRALAVDGGSNTKRQEFYYQADLWLADFTQNTSVDLGDLVRRLALLENDPLINENADLRAASLYLRANIADGSDSNAITHYRETVLNGASPAKAPFLGKLVLMTQIKTELDRAAPPSERVISALPVAQELRTLYPNYPNGHLLTAMLLGMQADALASGESHDAGKEAMLRKIVSDELSRAGMLDPDFLRIVRVANTELPADLLKDMDEARRRPDLTARLSAFANSEIAPLAHDIVASEVLAHLVVDRTILYATRRGLGERRVARAIAELPSATLEQQASRRAAIAQQFLDIDSYLPAENWLESARKAVAASPNADSSVRHQVEAISQSLEQAKISNSLAAVI